MVSGAYEKIFRRICIDEIDILRDRIGGSAVDIEVYIRFFARRKYIDAAVFRVQSPACLLYTSYAGQKIRKLIRAADKENRTTVKAVRIMNKMCIRDRGTVVTINAE